MAARGTAPQVRGSTKASSRRRARRYAVPYDISGPRVRLGVLWFLAAAAALAVGPLPTALVYGGAAAAAAAQTARCWRRQGEPPSEPVAAGMAGAMGVGACLGAGGAGIALLGGVCFALATAVGDRTSRPAAVAAAGWTIQCALVPGLVGMSMVLLARLDQGSVIALLLLVSAYETGDYLVGTGSQSAFEGPAAGIAAIVVITFIVSTTPFSALSFGEAWFFGGVVAVTAPLGQLAASALLPTAAGPASALRRLDSLLIAAPLWCWGLGLAI